MLSFTCTKYSIAKNGEVVFFLGATVFGDVRFNFSIVENENEFNIFNLCVHSSFISDNITEFKFDGSQLDPCHYEYLDEIFNWTFKLELFPIPSSNKHLLFENNKFESIKTDDQFWIGKEKEFDYFEKLKSKSYLDPPRILKTMYHNNMLSKHNFNVSNLSTSNNDLHIIEKLSKLIDPSLEISELPDIQNLSELDNLPNLSNEFDSKSKYL